MRYEYIVELKKENERHIDTISSLLCILSVLAFSFNQINTRIFNLFLTADAIAITIGLLLQWIRSRHHKPLQFKTWLLLAGLGWLAMPWLPWLAALYVIFAFLEYQAKYPLQIGFGNDEVVINSLFRKRYSWNDFSNIILKDGLLTLDFKNNKILQRESTDDDDPEADEDEFNEFCRLKLGR